MEEIKEGEALGQKLLDIFTECTKEIKDFIPENYNPFDINDDTFNAKYINFKDSLKELERKNKCCYNSYF